MFHGCKEIKYFKFRILLEDGLPSDVPSTLRKCFSTRGTDLPDMCSVQSAAGETPRKLLKCVRPAVTLDVDTYIPSYNDNNGYLSALSLLSRYGRGGGRGGGLHNIYNIDKKVTVFVTLLGPWSPSLKALSAIGTLISSFVDKKV